MSDQKDQPEHNVRNDGVRPGNDLVKKGHRPLQEGHRPEQSQPSGATGPVAQDSGSGVPPKKK
jgi:hypothetical protein